MPLLRGPYNARPPAGAAPHSGGRRRKRAGLELLLRNPLFFLIFAVRVSQKFCRATIDEASDGNAYMVSSDAALNIFEPLNIEKHFTAKGLPSCSGPGFYLMDPADSIRLSALLELSKAPYNIPPPSICGGHAGMDMPENSEETDLRTPLLYSSSNRWHLTDQIYRYEWGMCVYYAADNEWCLYPPEGFR